MNFGGAWFGPRRGAQGVLATIMGLSVAASACSQPGATSTALGLASPAASAGTTPIAAGATPTPGTAGPSATPAISGLRGRIVFTRAGGSFRDESIFVANIDGSDEVQIGVSGEGCCPWALRDGSVLIRTASSPDGLMAPVISKLDGSDSRLFRLPDGLQFGAGPISPDGTRVALEGFTASGSGSAPAYIANLDGAKVKPLTDAHFIPADFAPDGQTVLLFREGPAGDGPPSPGTLWLVGVDGSNERRLTPSGVLVQCCAGRWSPDGGHIIFASPEGGLWTIDPDGTGLTEVFHAEGQWAITPAWSPDGSMVIFGLDRSKNPFAHPANGLYVIRADGTGLTLVLGGTNFKRSPTWVEPG